MSTYESDGLSLHYEVRGRGPEVLCVHGATGSGRYDWSDIAEDLGGRYRFVMPDLRGHGRSAYRAGDVGIDQVVGDLLRLIDHERMGRPNVLAFSFGSEVALDLELLQPGTAASLVLVSPGLGDPQSSVPSRERLEATWPGTLRALHADHHGEDHWLHLMVELCERAAKRPKIDLQSVTGIGCPVLLIVGSADDPRRIRQAELFVEARAQTELVVISGAGHAVHKTNGEQIAAHIADFLDALP